MKNTRFAPTAIALVVLSLPAYAITFTEGVPLYTREDLDRMFGPVPKTTAAPRTAAPMERTEAADWESVERFIEREYARLEAERRYDMERRAMSGYGGACPHTTAAEDGYSGTYFPAYWLYPYGVPPRHFGDRHYRANNPQLPFGDRTLPRALPPGGLHPTLKTHPTAPTRSGRPMRIR